MLSPTTSFMKPSKTSRFFPSAPGLPKPAKPPTVPLPPRAWMHHPASSYPDFSSGRLVDELYQTVSSPSNDRRYLCRSRFDVPSSEWLISVTDLGQLYYEARLLAPSINDLHNQVAAGSSYHDFFRVFQKAWLAGHISVDSAGGSSSSVRCVTRGTAPDGATWQYSVQLRLPAGADAASASWATIDGMVLLTQRMSQLETDLTRAKQDLQRLQEDFDGYSGAGASVVAGATMRSAPARKAVVKRPKIATVARAKPRGAQFADDD